MTIGLAAALALALQTPTDAAAPPASRFKCDDGGELLARFEPRDGALVARVETSGRAHALIERPWTGGPTVLTWSDGARTLTWSPGVRIMWMDGPVHRLCGRADGHKH
jgi:hypothetical protein